MLCVARDKAQAYIDVEAIEENGRLDTLLALVCAKIARHIGTLDFGPLQSRTEYHDGGQQFIYTRYFPIISVTSIHDDDDRDYDATTLLDTDEYYIDQNDGRCIYSDMGTFTAGDQNLKVVYTAGWESETTTPDDIQRAALIQFRHEHLRTSASNGVGAFGTRPTIEGESDLLPQVRELLRRWRRVMPYA